jgi:hypothetical protein
MVLTSPPFLGTTDFLRQNRLRNWLVGWNYKIQNDKKKQFLEHQTDIAGYPSIFRELYRVLRPNGLAVFHVGVVKAVNMAEILAPLFGSAGFQEIGKVWEDTTDLESHGRTDRGGTHKHGFVICIKK